MQPCLLRFKLLSHIARDIWPNSPFSALFTALRHHDTLSRSLRDIARWYKMVCCSRMHTEHHKMSDELWFYIRSTWYILRFRFDNAEDRAFHFQVDHRDLELIDEDTSQQEYIALEELKALAAPKPATRTRKRKASHTRRVSSTKWCGLSLNFNLNYWCNK